MAANIIYAFSVCCCVLAGILAYLWEPDRQRRRLLKKQMRQDGAVSFARQYYGGREKR